MTAKSLKNKGETCRALLIENQCVLTIGIDRAAGPDVSVVWELDASLTPRGVVSREACRPTVRPHTASWEDPQV